MNKKKICFLFILPCALFLTLFLVLPLLAMFISTVFMDGEFTLVNYTSMLTDVYFHQVFWRSMKLSVISTLISAVLGFPVAYFIAKITSRKGIYMALAVFPLLTSPVVRSFGWMVILGQKGMINNLLTGVGVWESPVRMLYTEFSMVIGFVQLFLPLMILSLVGIIESISDDLVNAACNLGAPRPVAFLRVILPLSISGIINGGVLVFTGCFTAYTTPQLLGGTKSRVLATLIYQQAMSLSDWSKASVIAVVMIVSTILVTGIITKIAKKINPL